MIDYWLSYQLDIKLFLIIFLISAWSKKVRISVSDHLLTTLDSLSDSLMTYAVEDHTETRWQFYNFEKSMPANVKGRYVYTYLIAGGDIYIRELEVFTPFTYGQYFHFMHWKMHLPCTRITHCFSLWFRVIENIWIFNECQCKIYHILE